MVGMGAMEDIRTRWGSGIEEEMDGLSLCLGGVCVLCI